MNPFLTFCIAGVTTGLFLGWQFILKRKSSDSNYYLGIFFILIALRLGKLPIQELTPVLIQNAYFNIMHASSLMLGPACWLYVRSYFSLPPPKKQWLHFVIGFAMLAMAFHLRLLLGDRIWIPIYWAIQVHPIIYVISSIFVVYRYTNVKKTTTNQTVWLFSVIGALALIVAMNVLYFTLDFPFYLVSSVLLFLTMYLIIIMAFKDKFGIIIGRSDRKYKNLNISKSEIAEIWNSINRLMEQDELYLDDRLKIGWISEYIHKPPHIISMVVNVCSNMSFNDYVNELRIRKAIQKIDEDRGKKIISIAYESGFTSLSAFNRAFKKNTGTNPSVYRSKISS